MAYYKSKQWNTIYDWEKQTNNSITETGSVCELAVVILV